ncbi:hypothetical protein BRARA_E03524 [Brassica rapa]|uniref:Uncharacterized protein n=1 Tax=Brassica campestris TaxID=3711 RepID=A0A397ZG20_BRACM|nr:hypothetical protein BRARA_E03524 [Brassica rapa]
MNGSLRWSDSDLGSVPICASLLSLGSHQALSKNHISPSAGGLLCRRDLFRCNGHAPMAFSSESIYLLPYSSFDLVPPTVICSLLLEKIQRLQPSNLSPQTQADPPDLKLNYLSTAGSEILFSKNGVPPRFVSCVSKLYCPSGVFSSSCSLCYRDLSLSPGRSVTKTPQSTLASNLRPPTKWYLSLLMFSIPSVLEAKALLFWAMSPSEPLPPPDPSDPPDLVPGYYPPEIDTLQPHIQYPQSVSEQSFMGKLNLVGLSKSINECYLLCSREVQAKFPVDFSGLWTEVITLIKQPSMATIFTSSSTHLVQNSERLKLVSNSPVTLTILVKFIQTSSRQGRERSLSTSSFSKERIVPSKSLFTRGDPLPVFKTGKSYQFPNRLLSYVMVHLGPVDTTTLSPMRVEVLDGVATSYAIVTNRVLLEDLEVRFESSLDLIVGGNFYIFHNALSNFFKFVSLSLYSLELNVGVLFDQFAHRGLYDVVFILVMV